MRRTIRTLLIVVGVVLVGYTGYRFWVDVRRGPLGDDRHTVARLTQEFPTGLGIEEVRLRAQHLGIEGLTGPDAAGVLRFSVRAQMLIRVDAELRFDGSGQLLEATFTSVYTG